MENRPHLVYEFGPFRLDLKERFLAREGFMVNLAPKVLDTLIFLVQNRGRILEKDEIVQALWPQSFVEEGNLSQNIFLLRKLLGDDRNAKAFIQTIPRRGYKFVAEVKEAQTLTSARAFPDAEYWQRHSPFRGLRVFEAEDDWLFFGRETEIKDLLRRLHNSPVAAVVGNSGCGKSSLVRAGLIPALQRGRFQLNGSAGCWRIAMFRPSATPLDYLAEVLPRQLAPELSLKEQADFIADCRNKLPQGGDALRNAVSALALASGGNTEHKRVLLVCDQFEELFTLNSSAKIRNQYIECLLAAARLDSAVPVHLVLVLRADFYAACLDHPGLSRCLEAAIYNLSSMNREQLRENIEKRLALAAAPSENGLINALLDDVGAEPGNLALLEHALSQLWEKCGGTGRTLTNSAYAEIGRLSGALGRHADAVYRSLSDDNEKCLARRIFLQLVQLGDGAQDTRRRVSKAELSSLAAAERLEPVLLRLISSRLISSGVQSNETFVEVSHEALIREWATLREWLLENREEIRFERRLRQAAEEWHSLSRDPGALLHGARLVQGQEWLARHPDAPPGIREFLRISADTQAEARERELEQQRELRNQAEARARAEQTLREQQAASAFQARRSASRLRWLSGALALLMVVAMTSATFAYRQQLIEKSHALSARSAVLLSSDHGQALDLAIRSWHTAKTEEARLAVTRALPDLLATMDHDGPVGTVAFSPDGRRIVSGSDDRTVRLWDGTDGHLIATLKGHTDKIGCVAFSPDGRSILTASNDGTVRIWNSGDGTLVVALGSRRAAAARYDISVDARAAFSPDSQRVLTAGLSNAAELWSIPEGRLLTRLQGHKSIVVDATFSPDGRHMVTSSWDHSALVWSIDGRLENALSGHSDLLQRVHFFPDGRHIITTSWDHTARIWSIGGRLLSILNHDGPVTDADVSSDGRLIVTASQDHTARVWSSDDGRLLFTLHHDGGVETVVFSRDSRFILTAGDHTARVWSSKDGAMLAMLEGHNDAVHDAAFSPDGYRIVTASEDHTVRLWNTASGLLVKTLQGHSGYLSQAEFSPDGRRIITVSQDRTARLWSTDGRLLLIFQGTQNGFSQAKFSPDGRRIVTGEGSHEAQVWDSATGNRASTLQGHTGRIWQVNFSSDGQRIVTASSDTTARIWDLSGRSLGVLRGHTDKVVYAEFSPDGQRVVTASNDKTARLWNAADGQLLAVLRGHTAPVWRARFLPDGQRIVTISFDHSAKIWDGKDGRLLANLEGHSDLIDAVDSSPDGRVIVTASWDHTARLWSSSDGHLLAILQGHSDKVIDAVFSGDGLHVITSSEDHTVRLWSTADYLLLAVFRGHTGSVWQATPSPDGQLVVSASLDQTARIWRVLPLDSVQSILAK